MSNIIRQIRKKYNIRCARQLSKCFKQITSYEYLEEVVTIINNQERLIIVVIPTNHNIEYAEVDLQIAFSKLAVPMNHSLIYMKHDFPHEYKCPYGIEYMHCYLFFFTRHENFNKSDQSLTQYFTRINKLKVFL